MSCEFFSSFTSYIYIYIYIYISTEYSLYYWYMLSPKKL